MLDEPEIERERKFTWDTTHDALLGCDDTGTLLRAERGSHHFLARDIDVRAPLLWPSAHEGESAEHWLQRLPAGPGSHVVLLVQAGAIAMGYWDDEELLVHNAFKRYVVRGNGRAQPTHLKTRGKSRYGSRLRLQNFKRQLVELNERLHQWWEEYGCPQQLIVACPKRLWPELWTVDPRPPFEQRAVHPPLRKVPLDVRVPTHEELLRVHRFLGRGRVRWYRASDAP